MMAETEIKLISFHSPYTVVRISSWMPIQINIGSSLFNSMRTFNGTNIVNDLVINSTLSLNIIHNSSQFHVTHIQIRIHHRQWIVLSNRKCHLSYLLFSFYNHTQRYRLFIFVIQTTIPQSLFSLVFFPRLTKRKSWLYKSDHTVIGVMMSFGIIWNSILSHGNLLKNDFCWMHCIKYSNFHTFNQTNKKPCNTSEVQMHRQPICIYKIKVNPMS